MYHATSRLSVLKFAAATGISIAAVATALPGVINNITGQASASVQPTEQLAAPESHRIVAEVAAPAEPVVPLRKRSVTSVEDLPPAGTLASAALTAPHDPALPSLRFVTRTVMAANDVGVSAFAKPAHVASHVSARTILARLPQAKPGRVFSVGPDGTVEANPALLAYAAPPADIDAPFEAVMAGPRISTIEPEDDDLYRPRPRPDPDAVLGWLDGRALGQFAPGQHDWVRNPLPASVFDPKQQKCLTQGVYFEARGESEEGQAAVAQVILNRVRNPAYPNTICGVVYQNEKWRHHCQFSFACDGRPERVSEQAAWKEAEQVALDVTNGKTWIVEVGDSTHYHAGYVRPGWGRLMIKVDKLGQHIFYRTKDGGWS